MKLNLHAKREVLQAQLEGRANNQFRVWSSICIKWMQSLLTEGEWPDELPAIASVPLTLRAV
jgi:hypothetical protein